MEKYIRGSYQEISGDLIALMQQGKFDVVTHGCNCFCTMKSGIAPLMAKATGCDKFLLEDIRHKGDIRKLGRIDYRNIRWIKGSKHPIGVLTTSDSTPQHRYSSLVNVAVVNSYTQFNYGTSKINLDYDALTSCLLTINRIFEGQRIGLPKIGCGLAGGDWSVVRGLIQECMKDCHVTVVIFDK